MLLSKTVNNGGTSVEATCVRLWRKEEKDMDGRKSKSKSLLNTRHHAGTTHDQHPSDVRYIRLLHSGLGYVGRYLPCRRRVLTDCPYLRWRYTSRNWVKLLSSPTDSVDRTTNRQRKSHILQPPDILGVQVCVSDIQHVLDA